MLKKRKILYLHANNQDVGGADYCLFKLAKELNRDRFIPIVCLSQKTKIFELYQKAGIKTHQIDMERIKNNKNPIYLFKLLFKFIPTIFKIRKIIIDEKIDLIHGNDLLDIYGPIAGRLLKKPVAQYIRWILVSPVSLKNILTRIVYKINTNIITVSDGVAKEMFSLNGHIKQNVITCYDWIDMENVGHCETRSNIREEFNIPERMPVIGVVGRLEPWKGQEVFIKAASLVSKKYTDIKFLVVGGTVEGRGRDNYSLKLMNLVEELGLQSKVIFTGHRSDIFNIMNSLDIFVHSSITPDPLPGVILEAMFCSRPVVGANAGGVSEEIIDKQTGILYRPGDYKKMADAIDHLLKTPSIAIEMGKKGKERVENIFNKNVLCPKIEKIYDKMLKKSY